MRCGGSPHRKARVTQLLTVGVSRGSQHTLEPCMLVVEGLTCRFGAKAAVDDASFQISPGGSVGVIGRSGAGKSTLLRTINRLATPTQGRILFDGVDVTALRGKELRQWRGGPGGGFSPFHRGW